MKITTIFLLIGFSLLTILACDDDDSNNSNNNNSTNSIVDAEESSLEINGGYSSVEGVFAASIKVIAKDAEGNLLGGHAVKLISSNENHVISPQSATTDENGEAVFDMNSDTVGDGTIVATVSNGSDFSDGIDVTDLIGTLSFSMDISIVPIETSYGFNQGDFSLRVTIEDDNGPLSEVEAMVVDGSGLVVFTPSTFTTDSNGRGLIQGVTSQNGIRNLVFTIGNLANPIIVPFDFHGPHITGQVANTQHYPLGFHSARVTIAALNMIDRDTLNYAHPILGEFSSESTCPCPGPVEYDIQLPIVPDSQYLNDDIGNNIQYGVFAVIIYDDLNENYVFDEGEYIISAKMQNTLLHFARPLNGNSSYEHMGWNIVTTIDSTAVFLDWESEKNYVDMLVTRSPIFQPPVEGLVVTSESTNIRVAWSAVNSNIIPSGYTPFEPFTETQLTVLYDTANTQVLLDIEANDATWSATLPDVEIELTQSTIDSWKFSYDTGVAGVIEAVLVVGALYHDVNSSGDLDAGDLIIGGAYGQASAGAVFPYVISIDNFAALRNSNEWWFHKGYNYIKTARHFTIDTINLSGGIYTITLLEGIGEYSITGSFEALLDGALFTSVPAASGTYSSSSTSYNTITVNEGDCTGCNTLSGGDQLLFTLPNLSIDEYAFGDLFTINLVD
jgi:Bacterial Ig-like domain (group 1)